MENVILEQQRSRYELEQMILDLDTKMPELEEQVDGAGAVFMTLYEYMAEREKNPVYLVKKLFKKDDAEFIQRYKDAVDAEAQLKKAEEALEAAKQEREQAASQLAKLPSIDLLRIRAKKDPETFKAFSKAEAHYCAQRLMSLMDANWQALQELADFLQEHEQAPKIPQSEFNRLLKASIAAAEACQPYLDTFRNALGQNISDFFFHIREYYLDPKEFIWDARNGRNYSDRVNTAMKQVREQKDRVHSSLEWLERS